MNLLDALVLKELKGVGNETISALLIFTAANQLKTLEDLAGYRKHKLPLKGVRSPMVRKRTLRPFVQLRWLFQRPQLPI